jgi:hypothetical protein
MDGVAAEVAAWEGVAAARAGGVVELRYGDRPLGRLLPGRVEVAFHPRLREMLVETGRAEPGADRGFVALRVEDEADAAEAVELFRLAYERARVAERVRRTGRSAASDPR